MNENTSQPYSSNSASRPNLPSPNRLHGFGSISRRVLIIATGYMLTSLMAALVLGRAVAITGLGISLLSGILVGATFAPVATQLAAPRLHRGVVWASVLFLNGLSLGIEGAFFAPTLSPMAAMPIAWGAYLLFQSLVVAGLIAWLFGQNAVLATPNPPRKRPWHSWAWRFLVSAFSYLVFYFLFGAVNYALVTKPYYAAHVSGLAVPPPQTVLLAELVRAPLIVLSLIPLILLWSGKKRVLGVLCGLTLFVVGGVVPLLLNTDLPDVLRLASAIEIFFQNFLTGLVAVGLLGFRGAGATQHQRLGRLQEGI